jgi:hypothetical protein
MLIGGAFQRERTHQVNYCGNYDAGAFTDRGRSMVANAGSGAYESLSTLKPVTPDVWVVDGPMIKFGMPWPKASFPTRMTLVRVGGGRLFVHSPTPLTSSLYEEIKGIGRVAWIIGPNRFHYWWIREWREAYSDATVYVAPRVRQQAAKRIDFATLDLDVNAPLPWREEIATLAVEGSVLTEFVFFHRASRTLIVTDLIQNFEAHKLDSWLMRWLTWIGCVQDPDGQTPRDMRVSFRRQRTELQAAVKQMIDWNPDRVILAHGKWYNSDGAKELRRAF